MKMVRYKKNELPSLTEAEQAELKVLADRPDEEIDCSDIPQLDDEFWDRSVFWRDVEHNELYRPKKVTITAKIDADIVAWLKKQGRGYQTRMNTILRNSMMQSHQGKS